MAVTATTPTANRQPAPSRRDHQGEPSGNGEDGQQPGGTNNDVQFGETGADERSGRIDRLHRAPNEDVVEGLDGGEQGSEHGEVSESRRPGRGAGPGGSTAIATRRRPPRRTA